MLDHWSTVKPAYRVTLEDGTELIASGDHRFLTGARLEARDRQREQGSWRRPHLTLNDKLIGTGGFAEQPEHALDYRRGYLCGMIRGDGHLGVVTIRSDRAGRHGRITASGSRSTDLEALAARPRAT